ncbi:hypothetical protein ACNQVK_00010 [Mycobacterium sp. 134]|uniref:hypothetical protein n=1 Tax=Mycobacterium sp. 134 TaxID=3400425 RepID=UPI003AAE36AC
MHAQRPTEVIAALVDAREYIQGKRDTVLRDAAIALLESTRDVWSRTSSWTSSPPTTPTSTSAPTATPPTSPTITASATSVSRWTPSATPGGPNPPSHHHSLVGDGALPNGDPAQRIDVHPAAPRAEFFGAGSTGRPQSSRIYRCAIEPVDWINATVSGSDGSTYSSVMQIDTGAKFVDAAGAEVITFSNSGVVYLELPKGAKRPRSPLSVPLTRSAIDNPINGGMVMAPFMYRSEGLTDSSYEHMAKCVTDVVQLRAPTSARSPATAVAGRRRGTTDLLGGTSATEPSTCRRCPDHYQFATDGAMVREGVRLSHDVLRHIRDRRMIVFAGAVS